MIGILEAIVSLLPPLQSDQSSDCLLAPDLSFDAAPVTESQLDLSDYSAGLRIGASFIVVVAPVPESQLVVACYCLLLASCIGL